MATIYLTRSVPVEIICYSDSGSGPVWFEYTRASYNKQSHRQGKPFYFVCQHATFLLLCYKQELILCLLDGFRTWQGGVKPAC